MGSVNHHFLSPAKINLMLRILGQRDDGYHELQTAFQLLDWGDEMTFTAEPGMGSHKLTLSGFDGVDAVDNLITQAAALLQPWATLSTDFQVDVIKNIPMGAGLGGGSSNAATTLKFLNQAWVCDLSTFDLLSLAAKLGADVPVFLLGLGAEASGRGDVLTPRQFETPHILLLLPDVHVSTAKLFSHPALQRNQQALTANQLKDPSLWINDFFPLVLNNFPDIAAIYAKLKHDMPLRLSGSGGAMFAIFDDLGDAQRACDKASACCQALLLQPKKQTVDTDPG